MKYAHSGLLSYALAGLLVGLFIQTFEAWRWLTATAGPGLAAVLAPGLLVALLLTLAGWAALGRRRPVATWPVIAGSILALIALWLCDPEFPAKRIHVAEYVLLSLVVRRGVAFDVQGGRLTILSALITALFGFHDELAQGLHPDRSFALVDVGVNALSAFAGALIAQGLGLFAGRRTVAADAAPVAGLIAVAVGLAFLAVALSDYRDQPIPWWTMTPILAAGALWFFDNRSSATLPAISVAVWLALMAPLYPVLANVTPLVFH
jgi:hypothetical protein